MTTPVVPPVTHEQQMAWPGLPPLVQGVEMKWDAIGQRWFYIDHNVKTTTYTDPRSSYYPQFFQPQAMVPHPQQQQQQPQQNVVVVQQQPRIGLGFPFMYGGGYY